MKPGDSSGALDRGICWHRVAVPGWALETARTALLAAAVALLLVDAPEPADRSTSRFFQAPAPGAQTPWRTDRPADPLERP